jgi:hypothetical protein
MDARTGIGLFGGYAGRGSEELEMLEELLGQGAS